MSRRLQAVFCLFMVSGFGGLIYESVWTHYLKLFLGHSAYAQTLVLVVFIGGLAAGAWAASQWGGRLANPLRAYAIVELVVGLLALVFHPVFVAATGWGYDVLLPAACAPERSVCAAQWALSALLLAPQSVLIGATFPLVSSAVLRMDPRLPGRHISMLYFLNSFGAVIGVIASIFVLIPALGLPGTLRLAGAVNIAVALAALALARAAPPAFAVPPIVPAPGAPAADGRLLRLLLATALLTGLSSFIYEIVWIRMLSLVLGASTYSFELMLASFILGLALGGGWVRERIDQVEDPVRFLGLVQIVMGVAAAATLPIYNASFDAMAWLLGSVSRNSGGFLLFNLGSVAISLLVMLPATFCAGMTLPIITYRLLRSPSGERAIGWVYSANTVGSILGVIVAVHVLMTWLGVRGALLVGAAIDVLLGVGLIAWRARALRPRWAQLAPIPIGLAALAFFACCVPIDLGRSASGVFRTGIAHLGSETRIVYHQDGKTATVDVLADGEVRSIRTNGKSDAAISMDPAKRPTQDEMTMALLAIMPLAHRPDAATAAVIGLGSGMSTDVMLRSPNIRRVDTIEIEPAIVAGARNFLPVVKRAFDDPRGRIVIDDAKSYFARGRQRYDIIVSEPSNPWVSGVASLFTEEFYARLSQSLNEGGVLSQWLHTYEMDAVTLASILGAVSKTFPQFVVYSSNEHDLVLIARKGGAPGKPDLSVLAWPDMRPVVERLKLGDPAVLERRSFGSSASILALFTPIGAPANSDYRPLVEQRASRTRFTQEFVTELLDMQASPMPLLEMLDGTFRPADHPIDTIPATVPERAAIDAWDFFDAVMKPGFVPPGPPPRPDSREHGARLISMWARECPSELHFPRLLPSMIAMAEVVNPHLDRKTATALWASLEGSPCGRRLAPAERRWLDLFGAVAARDAARMTRLGVEILDASRGERATGTEYAFQVAATGLVCQGRLPEANRLFALGAHDWLTPGKLPISVRYLYALANLPKGAPRPDGPDCRLPAAPR
jgi:spermidine synthase